MSHSSSILLISNSRFLSQTLSNTWQIAIKHTLNIVFNLTVDDSSDIFSIIKYFKKVVQLAIPSGGFWH